MVACKAMGSIFCIFASLADASDGDSGRSGGKDSIPPSAVYDLDRYGATCGGQIYNGMVPSWADCQRMCDDNDNFPGCTQFTVYSRTTECAPPGHHSSMLVCTKCHLDAPCQHPEATDPDAAMFKRNDAYSVWPPAIWPGGQLLRQHNIYRCLHDVPPLRWSQALAEEAEKWAVSSADPDITQLKKQHPLPKQGGFKPDQLAQNVNVAQQPQPNKAGAIAEHWFDFTLVVDEWYNAYDETDKAILLNKNAIYLGCSGEHQTSDPDDKKDIDAVQTLVCNYGSEIGAGASNSNGCWNQHAADSSGKWGWCEICDGGRLQNCCTPDMATGCVAGKNCKCSSHNIPDAEPRTLSAIPPRNPKKTLLQCAADVDSSNQFQQYLDQPPKRTVTISYKPKLPVHLSASEQAGTCNIKEYRLVKDDQLKLVAIDADTNKPCDGTGPQGQGVAELHGWSHDLNGMYNRATGNKDCLMIQPGFTLGTDNGDNTCTRNNLFFEDPSGEATGGWHFSQQAFPTDPGHPDWCMPDNKEADKGTDLIITSLMIMPASSDGKNGCSSKWSVSWFDEKDALNDLQVVDKPTLQSAPASCSRCLGEVSNFACAFPDNQCSLAPTELDCKANGGTWCGPVDWKIQGSCGHPLHRCDGAVDPLKQPGQAGCHQLGGVYKTDFNDCALIADGIYTEDDCRASLMKQNNYDDQDVKDCVNLVKQTQDKPANVFDTVHGYIYDDPAHPKYCRLWYCSKLSDEVIPKQDGDQAWLIAYKTENTKNSLSIMV